MGFRSQNSGDRSQKKGKDTVAKATSWDHDPSTEICPLTPDPHAPEALAAGLRSRPAAQLPSGPEAPDR